MDARYPRCENEVIKVGERLAQSAHPDKKNIRARNVKLQENWRRLRDLAAKRRTRLEDAAESHQVEPLSVETPCNYVPWVFIFDCVFCSITLTLMRLSRGFGRECLWSAVKTTEKTRALPKYDHLMSELFTMIVHCYPVSLLTESASEARTPGRRDQSLRR